MSTTQNTYTGDGSTTNYSFTFEYLKQTDIKASLNNVATTAFTFVNATTLSFNTAPAAGTTIRIFRITDISTISATFFPGAAIRSKDLNDNFEQTLYVTQEYQGNNFRPDGFIPMAGNLDLGGFDVINGGAQFNKIVDLNNNRITNLGAPAAATDAATRQYVEDTFTAAGDTNKVSTVRTRTVATQGQTTVTVNPSFYIGNELVFINGAELSRNVDYTTPDDISVVFAAPLLAGDVIDVLAFNNIIRVDTSADFDSVPFSRNAFIATAGQTVFTCSEDFTVLQEQVFMNGALLKRNVDYTTSGTTVVTLVVPALVDDLLEVHSGNYIATGVAPATTSPYTYPGGSAQTIQQRLEQYVSVKDFGAKGDGVTDDTAAIQACIDANQNKTVFFPKGTYKITSQGTVELGAYATGETAESIAYCLKTSSKRTRLKGDGAILKGTWDGTPSLTSPIGVVSASGNEEHEFEALTFEDLQFGIANVKRYVNTESYAVLCKYRDLIFDNVGVGIYALAFERCDFRFIAGKNNALCIIAQGGMWNNANNTQSDASGFIDKCTIKNIINRGNPSGSVTTNSVAFDTWFDDHFFKTSKNSSLSPSGAGPGTTYPYQGISGRTIYAMARYSRPQNCNTINLVTHMSQHRGAVCFETGVANTLQGLYTENVGYADAQGRSQPIGGSATDPYLGAGVRLPYIVQGTTIEAANFQFTYAEKVFGNNVRNYERPSLTGCDITTAQTQTYREGTLQASGGINYGTPTGNASTKTQKDYEKGTWSPVWSFTGGGTLTPQVEEASYVKIGSMVTVILRQRTQGTIPSSGVATLLGLPYTPTGLGSAAIGLLSDWASDFSSLRAFTHPNSFLRFYKNNPTGSTAELDKADFTDGTDKNRLYLTVTYFTTDP